MSALASAMLVACHDCDEVHRVLELPDGGTAVCARCGGVLVAIGRRASRVHWP
jgi:uncharacterized paraquat-inducible protein A